MSIKTGISWTDVTWGPLVGCRKVSSGCANCYAVKEVRRLSGNPHPKIAGDFAGLVERYDNGQLDWTGEVRLLEDRLTLPLTLKKPLKTKHTAGADPTEWPEDLRIQLFPTIQFAQNGRHWAYLQQMPEVQQR